MIMSRCALFDQTLPIDVIPIEINHTLTNSPTQSPSTEKKFQELDDEGKYKFILAYSMSVLISISLVAISQDYIYVYKSSYAIYFAHKCTNYTSKFFFLNYFLILNEYNVKIIQFNVF